MKFHTNLPVRDIQKTTQFYSTLFDAKPVKLKTDYVKFLPPDLALNISFHESSRPHGDELHLGFEVQSPGELDVLYERLRAAGLTDEERETGICCYANQDKFWVTDPDGYKWEFYVLLEDTELKIERKSGCCAGRDAAAAGCC